MAKDSILKIDDRTRAAKAYLPRKSFFGQVAGTVGLYTANAVDFTTGLVTGRRQVFILGSLVGAFRGALYGGILAILAIAASATVAASGPLVFAVAAGVGALAFAMYDGQAALDAKLAANSRTIGDAIADAAGAVPTRAQLHEMQFGDDKRRSNFAATEKARRLAAQPQAQQPPQR